MNEANGQQIEAAQSATKLGFGTLFFRPTDFFINVLPGTSRRWAYLVAWVAGVSYAMGRIDSNILKSQAGIDRRGWRLLEPWLMESWNHYWLFVLAMGVINGLILWYLGGWWYRKRLAWSGATDVDSFRPRVTYIYQDFVSSGPTVALGVWETLTYSNYAEAWTEAGFLGGVGILLYFWSCFISYRAASTFNVVRAKARVWFLVLPIVFTLITAFAGGFLTMV